MLNVVTSQNLMTLTQTPTFCNIVKCFLETSAIFHVVESIMLMTSKFKMTPKISYYDKITNISVHTYYFGATLFQEKMKKMSND